VAEQERMIRDAKPGDIVSYVETAEKAPAVGIRVTIFAFPRGNPKAPSVTGHRVDEDGPWEVLRVEPIEGKPDRVKVYIRAC